MESSGKPATRVCGESTRSSLRQQGLEPQLTGLAPASRQRRNPLGLDQRERAATPVDFILGRGPTDISSPNLSSTQQRQQAPVSPNTEFGVLAEGAVGLVAAGNPFEDFEEGVRASTPIADFESALIDEWGGRTVTRAEANFLARLSVNQTGDGLSGVSEIDGGQGGQAVDELRLRRQGLLGRDVALQVGNEEANRQGREFWSDHESGATSSTHSRNISRSTSSRNSRSTSSRGSHPSDSRSGSRSSSSASSDDEMARHFEKPPVFRGVEGDDPIEWVERYEEAAAINNWNDAAKAANMIRSLEGPARKWYLNITRPAHWDDIQQPQPVGADVVVAGRKSIFFQYFQPEDFGRDLEERLRRRVQAPNEPILHYYFAILDMCRMLDANMGDDDKVRHLMRGVEPRLMRDLYPRNVTTSAQFLEYARAHSHAEKLAREKESGSGAAASAGAPRTGEPDWAWQAYGWPHPHPKTVGSGHFPIPAGSAWPHHPFPQTSMPGHGHQPAPLVHPSMAHHPGYARPNHEMVPGPAGAAGGGPVCFVKRESAAEKKRGFDMVEGPASPTFEVGGGRRAEEKSSKEGGTV